MTLEGVISGFESCKPTWKEYNDPNILHFAITSDIPWKPTLADFAEKEMMVARVSQVPEVDIDFNSLAYERALSQQISSIHSYCKVHQSLEKFDDELCDLLDRSIMIAALETTMEMV